MRHFIVEVVIDAIILLVIILFLGLISVAQPFPFGPTSVPIVSLRGAGVIGFLSWAAVLVLVNRFARPVLVAFTGRLLFSTMGLFVVIINAIAHLHHVVHRPDQDRHRGTADPAVGHRRGGPLHAPVDGRRTPSSGSTGPISAPIAAAGSGASSSPCPRPGATRSSRTCACSRSTTRSTRPASTSPWRTRRSAPSAAGSPGWSSARRTS